MTITGLFVVRFDRTDANRLSSRRQSVRGLNRFCRSTRLPSGRADIERLRLVAASSAPVAFWIPRQMN
jgi:hypothetical protein